MHDQVTAAATSAVVKLSPPIAVVTAGIAGVPLQSWVYVSTILYALLQSAHLVYKWVSDWRAAHADKPVKPTVPLPKTDNQAE